ncbi:MAG: ABC transporter permease [Deltaproteobacteria bacterium]|jgi:ABC-type multidrug transport system permease subunit|nr:ABC transporter permease [Deltaproteobacteria bacterium]
MSAFLAIYLREMMILRRRLKRQLLSISVSPLLYLVTFGFALGGSVKVGDRGYLEFLLPGLISMASMTQAFAIAGEINTARFYFHAFEEFQAAPVSRLSFVLGETLAGLTRAFIAMAVVAILGFLFGVRIHCGPYLLLAAFLNAFAFAALAVAMAMLVKSHADQALLSNFIITPMAFLGGTFFPLDALPAWARTLLQALPLSHASKAIRADAFREAPELAPFIILAACAAAFFCLAMAAVSKARD